MSQHRAARDDPRRRASPPTWPGALAGSLGLVALVALVFAPSLRNGFVVIDDAEQIVNNPVVRFPRHAAPVNLLLTPYHGYIVPVTQAAQIALFATGGGAFAFHLAGLALHAAVLIVAFLFTSRVTRDHLAVGAALAPVAVHPLVVEPVCWATGLKDLLAALFTILATLSFLAASDAARAGQRPLLRALAAGALATLAMLAKPTVVLMGGAWLAFLVAEHARTRGARANLLPALPRTPALLAVATLGLGLLAGIASRMTHDALLSNQATFGVLRPLQSLGHQLAHALWPVSLHPFYYVDARPPTADPHSILGVVGLIGAAAAFWAARRTPLALLACALATAVYVPVSGLVPFPRLVADSYLYLPLVILGARAGGLLARAPRRARWGVLAALIVSTALRAPMARGQGGRWAGGDALWAPLAAAHPTPDAFGGYATDLAGRGQYERARALFAASFARGYSPEYLVDYGIVLALTGHEDDAECVLVEACFHSGSTSVALRNHAVALARRRTPPRYPDAARFLLPLAWHQARLGQIPLTPAEIRSTQRWLPPDTEPLPDPPPWPLGNCRVLKTTGAGGGGWDR